MATTEAECLRALREAAATLGTSPTKAEYEELGLTPASATIIRTVGGWNEAKRKVGLETFASPVSRVGPKPDNVDLPDDQSWDELSVDRRWHYRNVEWNTERTLQRRAKLRGWVNERKRERGCARCGETNPACLDFHHENSDEKELSVCNMITHGYGQDRLRAEIENCEVICANCHRKEHTDDEGSDGAIDRAGHSSDSNNDLREWMRTIKHEAGGCERCDARDPSCLDFHHEDPDEKRSSVGSMVSDGRPKPEIRNEIAHCVVLCANCHRREHFDPPEERFAEPLRQS